MTDQAHTSRLHTEEFDQSLLLLAHRALPLWPRLRTAAHLRRCPVCRARLSELTQTSVLLAGAVRGPALPPWSGRDAVRRTGPPLAALPALIGALVLLAGLCWGTLRLVEQTHPAPAAHSTVGGCRPDLPNSRCR